MIFLWTDILIWLLVAVVGGFAIYNYRQDNLRKIWRTVFSNKIAVCSLLILATYVSVALLDSLHFVDTNQNMKSVLDNILQPIKTFSEKTYSEPFATHSFSKETNQSGIRDFPLLQQAGRHLAVPADKYQDIAIKTGIAIIVALLLWFGVVKILLKKSNLSVKFTLLIILLLISFIVFLAQFYHIFGTDKAGQDVLYRAIKSIRTGLTIGTLTTLIMLPFAIAFGLLAGYLRGWVDDVIQYLYTTVNSIPGVLLIAAAILTVQVHISNHPDAFDNVAEQADLRLLFLCIILGITSWTGLCRILRSEVLKIREAEFVLAAQTLGLSGVKIMFRHLLPNVMHIVLIAVVLDFSGLVLAEAVLSYIGIGVDPNSYSWGNMINAARMEMSREPIIWWSLVAAFSFMFILVLAANLFADVVRAAFDPRTDK